MTFNFNFQAVEDCFPLLSRSELLSEVLVNQLYGEITNVWHYPGHVFVTTDNGRKLFTFDCKPIQPQQVISASSLDIQNSQSPIVDVTYISPSIVIVVEENGRTQWWRYTSEFDWRCIGNMELCSLVDSVVTSVTFLPATKKLVWCERQGKPSGEVSVDVLLSTADKSSSSLCIKAKTIPTSDLTAHSLRELEVFPYITLVNNCPDCDVFGMANNKLVIRTKVHKDQITVTIVYDTDLKEMVMFLGQERFEIPDSSFSNGLNFGSVLLTHLPAIIMMETNQGDLGVKVDTDRFVALSSCGRIEVFTFAGSVMTKIKHKIIPVTFQDSTIIRPGHWFLHKKHIGIIHSGGLHLYCLDEGACISQWTSSELTDIHTVIQTSSPAFLAWVLTTRGLMALQATDSIAQTAYTTVDNLPEDKLLQTAVLQLAHIHQLKHQGYDQGLLSKLAALKTSWTEGKGSHQSEIVLMIAPLMEEYWRLHDTSKALLNTEQQPEKNQEDEYTGGRFEDEWSRVASLPRRARESRLLMLSQVYPEELLSRLCHGITLDCEEVVESELPRWQALLGLEGWDLSRYELVCRLLFQLHPEKLCHFVQCAESASEKTVGVLAFVRKKHCLIFYKSACECLPSAQTSVNPSEAAIAQSKLILASGELSGTRSVEQALKNLLQHKLWAQAVELVKAQSDNKDYLPCYLYITMSALAQHDCLSEYMTEIFELMPSWKSFQSFSQLASTQPKTQQQQLSTSPSDLFKQGGDSDVTLGTVQPFLLKLIKMMEENSV